MAENSMKPRIRFKGYTDAWEQRKLGDIGSVAMNRRIFKEQTTPTGEVPFYKIGTFGGVADAFITEQLFEEFKTKYPYPKIGDILVSASGSIGRFVEYRGEKAYFQDSNIIWLEHDDSIDKTFLKAFYAVVKWSGLEGSTIKRLYNKNVLETEIKLPSLKEQRQVGQFFEQLDNLITLHQRKYDKFVNIKKALLEKMFPQGDETTPKIRFKGFTDAWEQREFNSIVKRVTEMAATDGLPRVEYEDIVSGQGTLNKDIYKKQSNKVGILFDDGDVLFGKLRPYLKNWLFVAFKGIAVGDFWVLRANNADGEYIYTLLQIDTFQNIANQATGTKMPRADWSLVSKQQFFIPRTIAEQHRIGVVFKQLDNLITLHQRQLEKLKNIKSALLEKMFV